MAQDGRLARGAACNGAECQEKWAGVACAPQAQARALLSSLPAVAALPTPMSQLSNSDLGSGRQCRQPCDSSQPSRTREPNCGGVPTPSATVVMSNACAKPMIVETIVQLLRSDGRRLMNSRS